MVSHCPIDQGKKVSFLITENVFFPYFFQIWFQNRYVSFLSSSFIPHICYPYLLCSRMKDKKDGKSRTPYSSGCGISLNTSPLATSTTEKDELNSSLSLRSYHHRQQHHGYYQALPPPAMALAFPSSSSSSSSSSNYSKSFQQQIGYNTTPPTDMYEVTNYYMKQSTAAPFNVSHCYTNGIENNLKTNYLPTTSYERPAVPFDTYYFNPDISSVAHHQLSGPVVPPFA